MGRIRLRHGDSEIELDGDEAFIERQLENFYSRFNIDSVVKTRTEPRLLNSTDESETYGNGRARKGKTPSDAGTVKKGGEPKPASQAKHAGKAPSISPERFDAHKTADAPSLEDFFANKKPGKSVGERAAVIGYYIMKIKGESTFSEGHIDYAYRLLKISGRPAFLRQVLINNKNQNDWFDFAPDGVRWVLTRTGEIFVEEKLPSSAAARV